MKFKRTYEGRELVNTAHVQRLYLKSPEFEQTEYAVIAYLTHGTAVMWKGDEHSCLDYMWNWERDC